MSESEQNMSKNVKAFYDGKQYDLAIKYGSESSEVVDKLYALSSMMILGKELDAINFINQYKEELYKSYPVKTLNAHFELLLKNKLYKDAHKALEFYENEPYVSQEVEELLRDTKERIIDAQNPSNKAFSGIDEIVDHLENSVDNATLSRVLFSLKDYNFNAYAPSLEKLLTKGDVHPSFRTFALIVMVDNKYDKDVHFLRGKFIHKVNPSKLTPPFVSESFQKVTNQIHLLCNNNITLDNTALQLLSYYSMDIYPQQIKEGSEEVTSKAFVALANKYLNTPQTELDEDVKKKVKELEDVINSTPNLEL